MAIKIFDGKQPLNVLGRNLFCAILDDCNFYAKGSSDPRGADRIYESVKKRPDTHRKNLDSR